MKKSAIALIVGSLFLAAGAAQAKEGGDQYPNGAETWYAGALPPPGTYFINYFGYYGGKLVDGSGDKVKHAATGNTTPRVDAVFDALRLVHITNTKILGANWGVHAILPIVSQGASNLPGVAGSASKFGIGDITIDPFVLAWHHSPELHTAFGVDINLPTGAYDKNDPRTSIGANYYSYEPLYAITWLPKGGWEVSGKFMYNIKSKNNDTKYQSGDEFHMDYLVGKHVGEWAFGIGGYYVKQLTNDKVNGTTVAGVPGLISEGRKGQVFAFGPSVKYTAKNGSMFIGQWQHETMVENRFQGDKLWFKMILPM